MLKKIWNLLKQLLWDEYNLFFVGSSDKLPEPLSREEETKYVELSMQGDEQARAKLIEHNLRLVVFLSKKYENTGIDFQDLITIDENAISSAFNININDADIEKLTTGYMEEISNSITADISVAQNEFTNNLGIILKNILDDYIAENEVNGMATIKLSEVNKIVNNGLESEKNKSILNEMEEKYVIPNNTFKEMYNAIIVGFLEQYISMMSTVTEEIPSLGGGLQEEEITNENVIENSKIQTENEVVNNENKTEEETNIEKDKTAILVKDMINTMIDTLINQDGLLDGTNKIAIAMTEAKMQKEVLTKVGELTGKLMESLASSFNIDTNKFANAFKFEMNEEEIIIIILLLISFKLFSNSLSSFNLSHANQLC